MKTIKYFSLILILLCFQGCPEYSEEPNIFFSILNKSGTKIYVVYSMTENTISSDEFVVSPTEYILNDSSLKIPAHTDFFIKRKLGVLIYKEQTLADYTWDEIRSNNIFDKQYIFTLEELKAMNYTIVYEGE